MFFLERANKGDLMDYTHEASIFKAADEGDLEHINNLIHQGIDLTQGDDQQRTALHYALMLPMRCSPILAARKKQIAQQLIEACPKSLTHQDAAGTTPVHLLALLSGFDTLLEESIRLNQQAAFMPNNAGAYPIHLAIANQQNKTAAVLLTIPTMADLIDKHQQNLMHHAARCNNVEALNLLLKTASDIHGAMEACDDKFKKPLDVAHDFEFPEVVEWLRSHHTRCLSH
jgi:ankyrin repeat protein